MGTPFMDQAIKLGHIQAIFDTAKSNFKAASAGAPALTLDAIHKFKKISERGHGYLLHDAFQLLREGRIDQSLLSYRLAAFCGFEVAQENVAFIIEAQKYPNASTHAFHFWNRAAIQGSSRARVKLADYYYYGSSDGSGGVRQDYYVAVEHYRFAEELRDPQAAFNLAYMYEHGLGLQQVNIEKTCRLLKICLIFRIIIWQRDITTGQLNMNPKLTCPVRLVPSKSF